MGVPDVPGLKLGGIDFVAIAEGYGVPGERTTTREEFEKAYQKALVSTGPVLIDARIVSD
jgi:benzoylformate decarboxylase